MKHFSLAVLGVALLSGCQSNYYAQKYRNELAPGAEQSLAPHTGPAEYIRVDAGDLTDEAQRAQLRGYTVIGYAKFTADTDDYEPILHAQADAVQADLVLSSITPEGFSNQVVTMDQATPNLNNQNTSGGYQVSVGGRVSAASMGNLSAQSNMPSGGTVMGSVPRSIYRAVFLRKRVEEPAPQQVGK
jgi:hypothetical protein